MINIVLYQPEIPPNTGNIIRICYATNAKLHIIKPIAFSLEPKFLKRAAAGRLLSEIEYEIHESYQEFSKKYHQKRIYFITRYGQKHYNNIDFSNSKKDIFLIFGKESSGIPKKILKANFNECLRIPMVAKERSLNLANSVMLLTYEVLRQQKFPGLAKFEVQKGKDWLLK